MTTTVSEAVTAEQTSLSIMNADQTTIELTTRQQELLLKGLQFVRSNVALDMQIPSEEVDANRQSQYAELDDLESMLSPAKPRRPR